MDILLVDDDEAILDLAELAIDNPDATLHTTQYRQEAYEMFVGDEVDYDAIISDYDMGAWDGDDLLEEVRSVDKHIPFFFHTGHRVEELTVSDFNACVTEYREKASGLDDYRELADSIIECSEMYD